jgi:protein phosphatase inhibitor 2
VILSTSLKWDEESLLVTEAMRGQAKMKIDEPRTPYIYYNPDTDPELQQEEVNHNIEGRLD